MLMSRFVRSCHHFSWRVIREQNPDWLSAAGGQQQRAGNSQHCSTSKVFLVVNNAPVFYLLSAYEGVQSP